MRDQFIWQTDSDHVTWSVQFELQQLVATVCQIQSGLKEIVILAQKILIWYYMLRHAPLTCHWQAQVLLCFLSV